MPHRVTFVGGARYPYPLPSGVEKKFSLITELGPHYVVGFSTSRLPRHFVQQAEFFLFPQFPLAPARYLMMLAFALPLLVWLILARDVGILVAQSPYEAVSAALAKAITARLSHRVALVVESHGDFERALFLARSVPFPRVIAWLMKLARDYSLGNADVLRAVSNHTVRQLRETCKQKPIVQFPAWTDLDTFFSVGADDTGSPDELLVFVGSLTTLKGIHILIDAFADVLRKFPSARLEIIGPELERTYALSLRRQVDRLALGDSIKFVGHLSQDKLAKRITRARALILPSISEALGRVVLEAQACATPVIGSRVGGIPELITHGKDGLLVDAGEVPALTESICWILEHPSRAREMGVLGRERLIKSHSGSTFRHEYEEMLRLAEEFRA